MVLLSGGIDSAACLEFYMRQHVQITGLHVTLGQPSASQELTAARRIAAYYRIPLKHISLVGAGPKSDGQILGRNAMLIFIGLSEADERTTTIALGIHGSSPYYDCSANFIRAAQTIVDGQCDGRIQVTAPFVEWTKPQIWRYCLDRQVPIELTYSCERGNEQPCGICLSCRDLEVLLARTKLNHSA